MGRRATFRVFGGLAGQLFGLAYAIYLHDYRKYRVRLVFDSGGSSHRPLAVGDLLRTQGVEKRGISWGHIHSKLGVERSSLSDKARLAFSGLYPATDRFGLVTKEDLDQLDSRAIRMHGYPTDFRVVECVGPDLGEIMAQSNMPDFLNQREKTEDISIHWRLGDYVDNPLHGVVTLDSIAEGLTILDPSWRNKNLSLFTDSPEIAKSGAVRQRLGNVSVISNDIWSDVNQMVSSGAFLGNHSGISQWVAYSMLAQDSSANVVLPTQWFASETEGLRALPSEAMARTMRWQPRLEAKPFDY